MMRVCVVTGSRADYGLLKLVMSEVKTRKSLLLQVVVTGAHLAYDFGFTWRDIEADGFVIDAKIEMLLASDTSVGITKSLGLAIAGFADAFASLKPDLLLVLGDRFEIFGAVSAAVTSRIPVAHIHGGEVTEGAIDDALRHAITKLSHLHFTAAATYQKRVIQMGESPERVYNVGGLGIDNIVQLQLLTRKQLEKELDFKFGLKNLLVTYHPVTLQPNEGNKQISELLDALDGLADTNLLFTMPNADHDSQIIGEKIKKFVDRRPESAKVWGTMGQLRYLSCIKHVDGVVGNSSSGLIEAPSLKTGSVNIGNRQKGRIKADSVIDCGQSRVEISIALNKLYSDSFQRDLIFVKNPYGSGGAASKIVDVITNCEPKSLLTKCFNDL